MWDEKGGSYTTFICHDAGGELDNRMPDENAIIQAYVKYDFKISCDEYFRPKGSVFNWTVYDSRHLQIAPS